MFFNCIRWFYKLQLSHFSVFSVFRLSSNHYSIYFFPISSLLSFSFLSFSFYHFLSSFFLVSTVSSLTLPPSFISPFRLTPFSLSSSSSYIPVYRFPSSLCLLLSLSLSPSFLSASQGTALPSLYISTTQSRSPITRNVLRASSFWIASSVLHEMSPSGCSILKTHPHDNTLCGSDKWFPADSQIRPTHRCNISIRHSDTTPLLNANTWQLSETSHVSSSDPQLFVGIKWNRFNNVI